MSCEFCDRTWRGDVVFEDDTTWVILHDDWSVRGHAMVVSKKHAQNISDLDEIEWQSLATIYRRAEGALLQATGADRAIVMKLGIQTPHLHLHIYPVSAALDRAAVMAIIDAKTREERDGEFVERLRGAMGDEKR